MNDGTKDKSMEMIEVIIRQHSNIKVINQENQGLSVVRSNGITIAKGGSYTSTYTCLTPTI